MKFENTEVFNFEGAIRGMRNPLESWGKSDSYIYKDDNPLVNPICWEYKFIIGENDLALMQKLIKAGSEHRKFMRQIFVSVDITAPLYWWKEFNQYKIGVTTDSCSTMHKLASTPITEECFELGELLYTGIIEKLEENRLEYLETKDKRLWKKLIVNLPESWLQKRTVTMSYENILNMVHQRKGHKLSEWSVSFISWAYTLPYSSELLFIER